VYKISLNAGETNYNDFILGGISSTTNVVIVPRFFSTEAGVLPHTAPLNTGGLLTDGSLPANFSALSINATTGAVAATVSFPRFDLTGAIAASPAPTATGFTVTMDSALGAGTTSQDLTGLTIRFTSGNRQAVAATIQAAVINSTNSVALTVATGALSAAPASGDTVILSGG